MGGTESADYACWCFIGVGGPFQDLSIHLRGVDSVVAE